MERTTIKEPAVPDIEWHGALYITLIPPYVPGSFNNPNSGVNQELPDQGPQKATFGYEIRDRGAKLVVQGDKLRARGAF